MQFQLWLLPLSASALPRLLANRVLSGLGQQVKLPRTTPKLLEARLSAFCTSGTTRWPRPSNVASGACPRTASHPPPRCREGR
nr:hypothetical protein SHINE37_43126 [Rhizobiaceae bacterium]